MRKLPYTFFDYTEKEIAFKPVFIVGGCRSGKSSLGRLLGSLPHHFHVEENWWLLMLPAMARYGMINKKVFVNTFRAWVSELVYDQILMRGVSFRSSDHSFVRKMKTAKEIDFSLNKLKSRADVDAYFKKQPVTVIFNLAEVNPFIDLLQEAFPCAPIILTVRNPRVMASEVYQKRWFSTASLRKPFNKHVFFTLKMKGVTYYLPFWVDQKQARAFIAMSGKERAVYYCQQQLFLTARSVERANKKRVSCVLYETLVAHPEKVLCSLVSRVRKTEKTKALIKELAARKKQERAFDDACAWESAKVSAIQKQFPALSKQYHGKREK